MSITKKFLVFNNIVKLVGKQREPVQYLEDALEDLSQCCGIDCCKNVIRLRDQVTNEIVELSVRNGILMIGETPVDTPVEPGP
jgi:hypothetical protein